MNDNNIEPIAWQLGGAVAVRVGDVYRMVSTTEAGPPLSWYIAELPPSAVPLVRRDEAQAELEREQRRAAFEADRYWRAIAGAGELEAERDRWKAECEKAQAERDEAREEVRRLRTTLRMEMETDGIPIASAVDPDPTSASRLRLAIETLDKLSEPDEDGKGCSHWSAADLRRIRRDAEVVAAREQERDAEIAVLVRAFSAVGGDGPMLADAAAAALDDLAAHRNERSEK